MNDWQSVAAKVAQAGAPILGGVLGGPAGGALGGVIGQLIGQALGVPPTPEAINAAIDKDPTGAGAALSQVEASHKTAIELAAEDIQNARAQTVDLAKAGSSIAWGAPVVSVIGLGGFMVMSAVVLTHALPAGDVPTMVVSTFRDIGLCVVYYWLGSSYGSHQKDAALAAMAKK